MRIILIDLAVVGNCVDPKGRRVDCNIKSYNSCPEGCDAEEFGFDCKNSQSGDTLVLICPIVSFTNFVIKHHTLVSNIEFCYIILHRYNFFFNFELV